MLKLATRTLACALVASLALFHAGAARAQAPAPLVANAGEDILVECASSSGTPITLNGTLSSVGTDITYLWTAPGVAFDDPTILTPTGDFPLGTTTVTLTVTQTDMVTQAQTIAMDTVDVTVQDTTPPVILAEASPTSLWPPNHKLHKITVGLSVTDTCDPDPVVTLDSITSNEPDNSIGDGNTVGDIQDADVGTDDRMFLLRAERQGPCTGRVYTAIYDATDASGNSSLGSVQISVPHDQGQGKKKGQGNACGNTPPGTGGTPGGSTGNGNGHGPKK
jgi:hypothetical protein